MKDAVELLAERMYKECYLGHIPWEQWRKLAEFAIKYAEEEKKPR